MTSPEDGDIRQPDRREQDRNLLEAVLEMTQGIEGLRTEVGSMKAYQARQRKLFRLMAASVIFDIGLSVGLGYSIHRTNDAADRATRASSSGVVTCRARNASNEIQRTLWDTILAFPTPADETAEAKERRLKFTAYLDTAFAVEDCEKR